MPLKRFMLWTTLVVALGLAGSVQAAPQPYLLTGNSAGQAQIGTGLPLPVGTAGIFLGGMTPGDAANFPPLFVPAVTAATLSGMGTKVIIQQHTTAQGGAIQIPPGVLARPAPGTPTPIGVFPTNNAVFQVATTINYAWPNVSATLAPGAAPGPAVLGTGGGGVISYSGGAKAFGGPAQFAISPGSGAGSAKVPSNTMGVAPVASVWINAFPGLPGTVTMVALVGASNNNGVGQQGAPISAPTATTMFGPVTKGVRLVNQTVLKPAGITCCPVTTNGLIISSIPVTAAFPSNMVTGSKGFPWTTGLITVSQPGAVPPEIFWLSGTDMRVAGAGNISLVSGTLSTRQLSGPNANRGWLSLTLPEPTAMLGASGALGMLALCHGLVRRRSS